MDPAAIAPEPASGGGRSERHPPQPAMLGTLRRHGVKILRNAAIITLVVTAASFLIPNKFTAATLLLPPSETNDLSSLFSGVSGALALTRAFGMSGQAGTDIYLGVLRSATVNGRLVRRFGLVRVYHSRDEEEAGKTLRSHTALSLTNEGFVRVSVTERDRRLAADLANAYAEELDAFMRLNTNSTARQRREFIEKRLAETKTVLANAEDALQERQVSGHLPSVGGDVLRTSQVIGELMSEKVGREVELGTLQGVARGSNARADQLRAEIRQIDVQISKLPPIATRLGRLYRTVSIHEKVLLVLTEEYERARMLELRNIPTVEVVDAAQPPLHKSQPRRSLFALAAFIVAFVSGGALSWMREGAMRAA
jgi:tyrosine-protein kinase Etk/Wzc